MKTIYININGEDIQSTDDIIVVGRPEDAIVNKFFFELGKEILKGVVAPGITSIKKKDVVMDFKAHDEKSFNSIMEQWDTLKQELLGENPSGTRTVKLPDEYISWLQNSSQSTYAEIAKSLYHRGGSVEISLDKIYKNAIGVIVNNIEPEECKDCGQFVVNDDVVTDDSAITGSIKERVPQIAFVPFKDFGKCPKCGKNPCESESEPTVCPKCGKNPCECKVNIVFAIANDDICYKSMFQLYDISGQLIDNRHFLMIFDDDFDFRRNIHYDRWGHFISEAEPLGEAKNIRPLLGFCVEDQHLYLISKKAIVKICDYSNGECVHNKNGGNLDSRKSVGTEDNFIIVNEGKGRNIYEINGLQVIKRGEYANSFKGFKRWIFEQDKYNYVEESNHLWPIVLETKERINFNGYRSVFYLGLTGGGQELFVAEPGDISGDEDWHVINKEKKVFYKIRFDNIVSISKDRKYIVSSNAIDGHIGISSIDGKMIVGQQYTTIKEVGNGIFKFENAEHEINYYLIKNNLYYQNIFKDFIQENNSLISWQSNGIVINDCAHCTYIMSDLYYYIDTNNNGWIINKEGEKKYPCPTSRSFNSYGVALDWWGKKEQTITYCKVDGSEGFFKIHWYEPWKRDEVCMFTKEIVYIKMFRHKRRFIDEVKECLLTMDGRIIFSRTHDDTQPTQPTIIKLSEQYFSAPVSQDSSDRGVFDMTGKRVLSLSGRKIIII